MTAHTPILNLELPDFNIATWHDQVNNNFTIIDAAIGAIMAANTFLALVDTPDSYLGQALKYARVNAAETGLEFVVGSGGGGGGVTPADIANVKIGNISCVADGRGGAPSPGIKGWVRVEYAGTIVRATMTADQIGSAVIDVWRDTYANFPPTIADTICAAAKPTLSAAIKSEDSTLAGWNLAVNAGDFVMFNLVSASGLTQVRLDLKVLKS